jgi:hypothetical protein
LAPGHLEYLRKTLDRLKRVDRKAIGNLLEALKSLDSDEDQAIKPKQASKKESKKSETFSYPLPRTGLNPRAPAFRERSSRESTDGSQGEPTVLNVTGKQKPTLGYTCQLPPMIVEQKGEAAKCKNEKCGITLSRKQDVCPLCATEQNIYCSASPPPRAPHPLPLQPHRESDSHGQDPTMNICLLPPTIINHEDGEFQEFCRANNFIPLIPVSPDLTIPLTSTENTNSQNVSCIDFKPDPIPMAYMHPFNGMEPTLSLVQTRKIRPCGDPSYVPHSWSGNALQQSHRTTATQDLMYLLEETSEPIEDDHREAKPLAPAWGAQILENFVKRYPMTGRHNPEDAIFAQKENKRFKAQVQQTKCSKFEGKSAEGNRLRRAAEIQQNLEMILFQQREKKTPLVPIHKIKATEIQQNLEIMLYKLKEQKALASFSKRVSQHADGSFSDKSSESGMGASRSSS